MQGSLNVHLPPIVKRRSGGFVALENIVPSAGERTALIDGKYSQVIVYDQNTSDMCLAEKDSNLYVIMQSLKQQVERTCVVYLTGKTNVVSWAKQHATQSRPRGMLGQFSKLKTRSTYH